MGLTIDFEDGQTPLDETEKEGLLIHSITTRAELNEFEQQNIETAIQWTLTRNFKQAEIFSEKLIKELHSRMFGNTWNWAGEYRRTNKNLGVDKWMIATELQQLLQDAIYWTENQIFSPDEIAIRFKHRIVTIHCFANGNGRHSRLIADLIMDQVFKQSVFSWGAGVTTNPSITRYNYLTAIKAGDNGDFSLLLAFARS